MHLRHAAQTVGILHPRIVLRVRRADLAFAQKRAEMAGDRLLPGMRAGVVNARVESDRGSLQRFEGHRAGDIGDARETFRPEEGETADGVHRLGAVEQRQAFFRLEIGSAAVPLVPERPHSACARP